MIRTDSLSVSFSALRWAGEVRLIFHGAPGSAARFEPAVFSKPYPNMYQLRSTLQSLGLPLEIADGDPERYYQLSISDLTRLGFPFLA
jgi:hypothetical protein